MKVYCHEQHFKPFARELNSINQYTNKNQIKRYETCNFNPYSLRFKDKEIVTWYYIQNNELDIEINEAYIFTISLDNFYNYLKELYNTEKIDIDNYWKKPIKEILLDMQQLVNIKIK